MKRSLAVAMAVAVVVLSSFALVGRTLAAVTSLTGTITTAEPVTLSGNATAIVTLVDQTASPDAGGIIGEQRIDGVGSLPVAFDVPYDGARIVPTHAYAPSLTATRSGPTRSPCRPSPAARRSISRCRSS